LKKKLEKELSELQYRLGRDLEEIREECAFYKKSEEECYK